MMMIKKTLLLLLILFAFACNYKSELEQVALAKQLIDYANDTTLSNRNICNKIPFKTWDEIVVVGPYTTEDRLKSFDIEDFASVKGILLSATPDDSKCTLVYLKAKKAIAYSVVNRFPVDFAKDGSDAYSFKLEQCDDIVFKKQADGRLKVVSKL